jgi:hypothetical protein
VINPASETIEMMYSASRKTPRTSSKAVVE